MEEKLVFYAEPATMAQPTALGNGKLRFKKGGGGGRECWMGDRPSTTKDGE